MSPDALLATVAARLACAEAGLSRGPGRAVADERIGAYVACGIGAAGWRELVPVFRESLDEDGRLSLALLGARGLRRCNPLFAFQVLQNMALCFLSIEESIRGDHLALAPWDGAGAAAFGSARSALLARRVDAALACGTSAMAGIQGTFWLASHGLLASPGLRPRPFESSSGGLVPADGAAAVILERVEDARARGRRPLALLRGVAQEWSATASFAASCDPAAVRRVAGRALAAAGMEPRHLEAVVVSASGHAAADRSEAEGLGSLVDRPVQIVVPGGRLGALFAAGPAAAVVLVAGALAARAPLPAVLEPGRLPADFPLRAAPPRPLDGPTLVMACGPGGGVSALVLEAAG